VDVRPESEGFRIAVQLDDALPSGLVGKAGFNLEFAPDLYSASHLLQEEWPEYLRVTPAVRRKRHLLSRTDASCQSDRIVLSPEDPLSRVTINSESGSILLLDGRNVVRLSAEGDWREAFTGQVRPWGKWLRYAYSTLSISRKCESLESTRSSMQVNVPKRVCCRRANFFHSCRKNSACRNKVGQMSDQLLAFCSNFSLVIPRREKRRGICSCRPPPYSACLVGAYGAQSKYSADIISIRRRESYGYLVLTGEQLGRNRVADIS